MAWAETEFKPIDLGDKRNNARSTKIAEAIAKSPQSSIPQSCQDWAEPFALIQPHYDATEARIRASDSVYPR